MRHVLSHDQRHLTHLIELEDVPAPPSLCALGLDAIFVNALGIRESSGGSGCGHQ